MAVEYRAITADELPGLLELDRHGFAYEPRKPDVPSTWADAELDRTRVGFERGQMVGAGRNYTFEVTVPGGALVPAAAVSWVSVLPTHRRRGVLTGVMRALHDDARERGEPVSVLTASESLIYGRFGYGIATWRLGIVAERSRVAFARPGQGGGTVRFVDHDEALKVFPTVYDTARRQRAGMVTRPDYWWPEHLRWFAEDVKPAFRVVHENERGEVDGFAFYGVLGGWEGGLHDRELKVVDIITTAPSARASLWEYLFGVDLVEKVTAGNVPLDEPLRLLVTDPRRIRSDYVNDNMWVCILDEAMALSARTYATDGRLTLAVTRPDGGTVTVEVDGGPDGASCRTVAGGADLALGTAQLGSAWLGGISWRELHDAGVIDELKAGAIDRADRMFATSPLPATTSWF
jgi:predicted acetyltransferase